MERIGFVSPAAGKRPGGPDTRTGFGSAKRPKINQATNQHSPLSVSAGHAVFRMLCLVSQVGAVIGKSGSVIKKLQQSTGAKIRVEEAPPNCPDRVVTIIAHAVLKSKVKLEEGKEEEVEISKVQEALIRVLEVIIGSEAESGTVSCRLLAETSHAGAVIGKGGNMVNKIRKETGCKVSIRTEKMPSCADPDEEMIEIEGPVSAVKKALLSISGCLQERQPVNKARVVGNKCIDRVTQETLHRPIHTIPREALPMPVEIPSQDFRLRNFDMLSQSSLHRHIDAGPRVALYRPSDFGQREVFLHDIPRRPIEIAHHGSFARPFESFPTMPQETHPQLSENFLLRCNSVLETPPRGNITTASESKVGYQEVVFKILCSNENAGGVIGKGGNVVRVIYSETGASINVGNALPDCDERLIAVTASENPEDKNSPSQKAIILVFSRLFDLASNKGLENGPALSMTIRLVVPTNQIGCLLGKGGSIVTEMRKTTGAMIQVLKVEQNPKCVTKSDQVVQISGEFSNVKEAIYHVTSRLRDNFFASVVKNTAAKGSAVITTERNHRGNSDVSVSVGSHSSYSHLYTIPANLNGRYENSFSNGSHLPVNYPREPYMRSEDLFPDRFHVSSGYSPNFSGRSIIDHTSFSQHLDKAPSHSWASLQPASTSRGLPDASGGLSSTRAGFALSSGSKSAIVTNTTVEIRVPENAMNFVYGENGQNLEQLRQISGARVIVHESRVGASERMIVISGTPDQTQAAQNLLHAFILTGETTSSSFNKYTLT